MSSPDPKLDMLSAHLDQDPAIAHATKEAARAEARAAAARVRAMRLREQAETTSKQFVTPDPALAGDIEYLAIEKNALKPEAICESAGQQPRRWFRRPTRRTLAAGAAALITCAGAGVSGYVVWHHRMLAAEHQRAAEFAAAARDRAITFTSINAGSARNDVQRIIDESTGPFKAKILITADDMVKTIERSKISTKGTVKSVVVESMTNESAVLLVAAKADATGPDNEKPRPSRSWRMIMTLQRDGGQLKIANIEMLP